MPQVALAQRMNPRNSVTPGSPPLHERLAAVASTIGERLLASSFADATARLAAAGVHPRDAAGLLDDVVLVGRQPRIAALKERLGLAAADVTLERWLLLQAILQHAPRVEAQPVPDTVKRLLCDEWEYIATPDPDLLRHFRQDHPRFVAMAKTALLRRFPAGLFQWEVGGLERRWLLRMPWRDLPRVVRTIAVMQGVDRMLMPHLNARRKSPWLTETAANRSYYLMAQTLERRPELRGICAASWFRSPQIVEVAPHLAWVNRVFLDNGGVVTTVGPADANSGVFANNPQRKALYEAGKFTPLIGLNIWPRDAAIAWMRKHPEFAPKGNA